MADRIMPHNIEAEEAVLGSLLIDTDSYYKIASWLRPEDFYREKNAWVYAARQRVDVCDQVTIAHQLSVDRKLEEIGGVAYLSHLVGQCATSVHIEHYANIVKKCSDSRKVIKAAAEIESMCFDMQDNVLDSAIKKLIGLQTKYTGSLGPKQMADVALTYYSDLASGALKPNQFGIPSLDKIGGMQPGEYVVIGGETEMGKTTIMNQIAKIQPGPVLFCTTEMTKEQWARRELAQAMRVKVADLGDMNFIRSHEKEIIEGTGKIAKTNLHIITGSIFVDRVYTEACRIENLQLIVVDYIQRLREARASREGVSRASGGLADIAKELCIPVIASSQLSREKETKDGRPKTYLERLKESGDIENDADWAVFIERDKGAPAGSDKRLQAKLFLEKHRQGGEHFVVDLKFNPRTQRYDEGG